MVRERTTNQWEENRKKHDLVLLLENGSELSGGNANGWV
jgi:hypothetical protein